MPTLQSLIYFFVVLLLKMSVTIYSALVFATVAELVAPVFATVAESSGLVSGTVACGTVAESALVFGTVATLMIYLLSCKVP